MKIYKNNSPCRDLNAFSKKKKSCYSETLIKKMNVNYSPSMNTCTCLSMHICYVDIKAVVIHDFDNLNSICMSDNVGFIQFLAAHSFDNITSRKKLLSSCVSKT